jgi:hypothetical protein
LAVAQGRKGVDQIPHCDLFLAAYYTAVGSCQSCQSRRSSGGAIQL